MFRYIARLFAIIVLSLALLSALPAVAQAPTLDSAQINHLDDSRPAQGSAFVSVLNQGQAVTGLPAEAFNVYVDNQRLETGVEVAPTAPGVAVMVLVDISGSMDEPGILTDRRLTDAQQFARQIVEGLNAEDWVGLVGFGSELTPIENLTLDHGRVLNTIGQLPKLAGPRAADQRGFTHLFDAVTFAAESLSNNTDSDVRAKTANMRKIIIVLSDGNDTQSTVTRLDAQRAANDNRISVYTVTLCSPQGQGDARFRCQSDDVRWLSSRTNGESLALQTAGDRGEIEALFRRLGEQRNQYQVDYRWSAPKGLHKCRIEVSSGGTVQSDERECFSLLEQPTIAITAPGEGARFTREQAQAGPVPIEVALAFPDGAPRNPVKIDYLVNGQPYATTDNPPFDAVPPVALAMGNLPGGDYTLVAILEDSYTGQRSDSRPLVTIHLEPWQPPIISLTVPVTQVMTTRSATMTMTIDAAFPDGVPRELKVTVRDEGVGTIVEASGLPPFEVIWPVEQGRHGDHLLVVDAFDGKTSMTQRSNEVRSVLNPTPLQRIVNWFLDNWYWLLLFLIVLVLLFYLWRRKPAIVQQWSQTISSAVTQRLSLNPARAKLVTLQGPHMGEYKITDDTSNVGRDPATCNVVILGDPSIGKFQAIIQATAQRQYWVRNMGVTNLTYINALNQPVQNDPHWTPLNDGDILYMGQTRLQFHVLGKTTQRLPQVP
jgi:hypothetical protein